MKYADYRGPIKGQLRLEMEDRGPAGWRELSTSAPFSEVEVTTQKGDHYVDLTVRVRMEYTVQEMYRIRGVACESTEDVIRRVISSTEVVDTGGIDQREELVVTLMDT